ncbi:hypothetical protein BTVI_20763 [Pitangus sulphuratus]|nr:hypothetical protein BTVI_20763 [Pitangus sulphuratus]
MTRNRAAQRQHPGTVLQENGNTRKAVRKKLYVSNSQNASVLPSQPLSNSTGRHRKTPRRSAALAANKLRLMSDVEEEISSSESIGIGCRNRKLPHRNASAAARRMLLERSEDDTGLKSESEKELEEQLTKRKTLSQPGSSAPRRKFVSESENGSSDSEPDARPCQDTWQSNGHKHFPGSAHPVSPRGKNSSPDSSEEDSKSHNSEGGSSPRVCDQSTPAHEKPAGSDSEDEADSEVDGWDGRRAAGKQLGAGKKAKVLSDLEDTAESEAETREEWKSFPSENLVPTRIAGNSKSGPHSSFRRSSDTDSEAESNNSNYCEAPLKARKRKRKGRPKIIRKESAGEETEPSRKVLRSRTCIINYKKHIKMSNKRKNPRRCATLAANKIKILSDAKEELSSSESVCTGRKNRRQLQGAAAPGGCRKKLLDSLEGDASLRSENEKEQFSGRKKPPCPESSAPKRKYISESENERTDWEAETPEQDHGRARKSPCAGALNNLDCDSSEENSTNHRVENGGSWGVSRKATSAHNHCTSNSEEEVDSDVAKPETETPGVAANKKSRASSKRSKVLAGSKETAESESRGKKEEKSSVSEDVEAPGTAGSSKGSFNCSSASDSGTANSACSDATETGKRKRKPRTGRKETPVPNSLRPSRRAQQRKRWKASQEQEWEELEHPRGRGARRRSKMRTRSGGRRTVRYHDGDDDGDT